jgi:hypothetical protein
LRVLEAEAFAVVRLDDPGDEAAVGQGDDGGLEALGDLAVGIDDRLQDVIARLARADVGQVGADVAAVDLAVGSANLVAADAFDLGLVGEDLPPALGVAAGQGLAVAGDGVPLGATGLVLREPVLDPGAVRFEAASIRSSCKSAGTSSARSLSEPSREDRVAAGTSRSPRVARPPVARSSPRSQDGRGRAPPRPA